MKFNCILCKGQDYLIVSQKTRDSDHQVVKCKNCLHVQLYPLPTRLEENEFYNRDKQTKLLHDKISVDGLRERAAADTQRRIETLTRNFKPARSLLDIGTGYGFFLEAAKNKGFAATGLEISADRLKIAQKVTDAPIWTFKIEGPNKTGHKFDIVTLFHVLEHIKDPVKLCASLRTYLKKRGVLILEVPNAGDYMLKVNSPYKNFYWQIAHISYFTEKIVARVLKKAGYKKIKITGVQRYSFVNAINWLIIGKPQLKNPIYKSQTFSFMEKTYKNFLTKSKTCDTLWIEARL